MSSFSHTVGSKTYQFRDLKDLMAKATPARSGDYLAGLAAACLLYTSPSPRDS